MKILSEYYSEDEDRCSEIYIDDNGVRVVKFYKNGVLIAERAYPNNALCYIEDAADNWVRGILKL